MKKFLLTNLFFLSLFTISAQQIIPCATDETYRASIVKYPNLFKEEDKANATIRENMNKLVMRKAGTIHYVPVVFHIVHGAGFENISQAQIMDQIRILNEDYRKLIGTNGFSSHVLAADMEIEFRLAQYDPNGKKHDGINRIYNTTLDSNAGDNTKSAIIWDSNRYLNVWVVKDINSASTGGAGIILGYAQFPWQLGSQPSTDGIIIRSDQLGVVGTGDASQAGRTLSHEIGHWLGLYHTFQGGCVGNTSSNCGSKGDQVCDTPPVAASSSGCQVGKNSCTNDIPDSADLIRDYMDYSDGTCMNMFTLGQKTRVNSSMTYRPAIFGPSPGFVQNLSYAGINTDGSYAVVPPSSIKVPYAYGFEEPNPTTSGWVINNFNNVGNGWQVNTSVSHSGNSSMYMHNFINGYTRVNSRDGFQTPEIDLSKSIQPTLEFYYAYAQKSTATNDSLTVRISDDFGMHELPIWRDAGSNMSTAGIQTAEYIPIKQEWKKVTVDLSAFRSYSHARFRFEFLNRRGNNVYVDDLAIIEGITGIEELKSFINFKVYPNPMKENTTISFDLKAASKLKLIVTDMVGNTVYELPEQEYASGKHEFQFNKNQLSTGIYLMRVEAGDKGFSHKLLIN